MTNNFLRRNSHQLKEAISTLKQKPRLRKKLALNAFIKAQKKFNLNNSVNSYKRLLDSYLTQSNKKKISIRIVRTQSRIVIGGPALQTILLTKRLSKNIFNTTLVGGANYPNEKDMVEVIKSSKISYEFIPQMGRDIHFYDDIISLIKLYFIIKKIKPHIVHTHTAKAGAIGRIAAYFAKIPLVFHTFHGHIFSGYFGCLKTKTFIFLERLLAKISTKIIVISEEQKKDIVKKYRIAPTNKVTIIPLGFEWENFFSQTSDKNMKELYHIPPQKLLIGSIGRIVSIKDHKLFLRIAQRLLKIDRTKFHFIIIGDGELRKDLENEISLKKLEQSFTFTGWQNLDFSKYRELDLLLLTSKNEGTPVAIIEALASGIPVVASAVGGVPDVMKNYEPKNLVYTRNPNDYVKVILDVFSKGEEVSLEVRKKIVDFYSADHLVEKITRLYLESLRNYFLKMSTLQQ